MTTARRRPEGSGPTTDDPSRPGPARGSTPDEPGPPLADGPKAIRSVADLLPDHANANRGTQRGSMMLRTSLERNGAGRSVVADKNGRLIAGNKTAEAARDAGLPVRVVQTDGRELVVVQRTDLDLTDPRGKARELAFADNRVGEVNLDWSPDALKDAFATGALTDLDYLFADEELNRMVGEALVVPDGADATGSQDDAGGSQDDSDDGNGSSSGSDPWSGQTTDSGASAADGVDFKFGDLGGRIDRAVYDGFKALVDRVRARGLVMMSDIMAEVVRLADAGDPEAFDGEGDDTEED